MSNRATTLKRLKESLIRIKQRALNDGEDAIAAHIGDVVEHSINGELDFEIAWPEEGKKNAR